MAWFSEKKFSEHKMCVFSTNLYGTFLILRRFKRDITIINRSSCKLPVIPVKFQSNLNFLNGFSKNTQIQNLMKIRPVGAKLFHEGGRTDERAETDRHDEVNIRFLNSSNASNCKDIQFGAFFMILPTP
jgi:hypothetical protein